MTTLSDTLDAIEAHMAEHGVPPTVRELAHRLGLSSSASAHKRIEQLEDRGLIERVGPRKLIVLKEAANG